jgi:CelD/BcsL family acetyltransferase involved in cellulose biosynthesis
MSARSADTAASPGGEGIPRTASPRDRKLRVIRSTSEFASIREAWLRLQGDQIYADPDYLEASELDPAVVRPHVVVLERDGDPEAMLVARIEELRLRSRLGYRTVHAPRVRSITVRYAGILGDVDEHVFREMLASVRASLTNGEADIAIFQYLPIDSPFYRIAATEPPWLARQHFGSSDVHWELELPASVEDVLRLSSSNTRKKLKGHMRRLEQMYEGRLAIRRYTRADEIDSFFSDVEAVAPKTYQDALGVALRDTPVQRARTRLALERGWFRGYVLALDDRPCSFQSGELYRGRFRLGWPGYDPALSHLRIGTYVLLKALDDLCLDDAARIVDFGIGDAEYKERFGTRSWREGTVVIYAPTFRGARINLTRTVLEAVIGATKRIAGRSTVARSLKRRFRKRARTAAGSDAGRRSY